MSSPISEIMRLSLLSGRSWDATLALVNTLPGFTPAEIREVELELRNKLDEPFHGYPPVGLTSGIVRDLNYRWYTGPTQESILWHELRVRLQQEGRSESELQNIDNESTRVLARIPAPHRSEYKGRGLVIGYVQSGKTTNLMSVIAKAADEGYRFIVVLSGVTNNLRNQTQERLFESLAPANSQRWHWLTDEDRDFTVSQNAGNLLGNAGTISIAVVKKNAGRLQRLINWLDSAPMGVRMNCSMLVIDDECDQASVNTAKAAARRTAINAKLMRLLDGNLMPRNAYIGYSATPFANLLIDTNEDDGLFPRDFVETLSHGDGYFGPDQMFGRDAVNEEEVDKPTSNGADIIRSIPDTDPMELGTAFDLKSPNQAALTETCKQAINWFILASAARARRETTPKFSSMLIHASGRIDCHTAMQQVVNGYVNSIREQLPKHLPSFRILWEAEIDKAIEYKNDSLADDSWGDIEIEIEAILSDLQIVVDNSKSTDRLDYSRNRLKNDRKIVPAIVIGGNTLSRGLTLEGLVSTYFLRTASAYDSLLQMGRWFGYRPKYADLQRIWMTDDLAIWFHDLATVEEEIRQQIARYAEDEVTPRELPVLIRTHPSMMVTSAAKMQNAITAKTGFAETRNEALLFNISDEKWLTDNLNAGKNLVAEIENSEIDFTRNGHIGAACPVAYGVPVAIIKKFLSSYNLHPKSKRMIQSQITKYIEDSNLNGELDSWNVFLYDQKGARTAEEVFSFSDSIDVRRIVRSRLKDAGPIANIHHLTTLSDIAIDLPNSMASRVSELTNSNAKLSKWFDLRNESSEKSRGLLGLYVIDKDSQPRANSNNRDSLDSCQHILGIAIYFPKSAQLGASHDYVQANPYSRDLSEELDELESEIDAADAADENSGDN